MRFRLALIFSLTCSAAFAQVTPGTTPLSIAKGGTGGATVAAARTSLGLAIGTNVEAWNALLDCFSALSSTGIVRRTGAGACSAGTTVAVNEGGTGGVTPSGALLDNISGFSATGFLTRTGTGAYTFQSATNGVTRSNLAQVAASSLMGNPTGSLANESAITLGSTLNFSGTTINATTATGAQLGVVKPDGTTITATGGVLSAVGGVATSIQPGTTTVTGGTVGDILAVGTGPTLVQFSPAPITNSLVSNVAMNNVATFFDGPSVAQGTVGTWYASGCVLLSDATSGAVVYIGKLWDGTTVIDSAELVQASGASPNRMCFSGVISSPAGNIKISVKDQTSTIGNIFANNTTLGKDSTITARRIQ